MALFPALLRAEPVETEIPSVTAEVAELNSSGGVTRLLVRYTNSGTSDAESDRFECGKVALIDTKSKQKHFPIKDANGQCVGGPIGDGIGGGRIYVKVPPGRDAVAWWYFESLPAGTVVSVELPQMFPFEGVPVGQSAAGALSEKEADSTPSGAVATLVSAKRADQTLKARLKLAARPGVTVVRRSPYFEYQNVYLFDPAGKRRYPLLKDAEGIFQATPLGQKIDGGTFLPEWTAPILMSLTFQAPPDDVTSVDLVLPDFLPLRGVAIEGLGGAGAGGVAASGKTLGLEGALKELQATVTEKEIKIDLAADVLFDFDKADLKPVAEETLNRLLTVVQSRPAAAVSIVGHTDVRGDEAYNQALSLRRSESVRGWLIAHGVGGARLTATGAGESHPLRSGDTEEDHRANRRVEIRINGA
jgi:outer membrane protein OmpA-like peptidoglycan-associated protein